MSRKMRKDEYTDSEDNIRRESDDTVRNKKEEKEIKKRTQEDIVGDW